MAGEIEKRKLEENLIFLAPEKTIEALRSLPPELYPQTLRFSLKAKKEKGFIPDTCLNLRWYSSDGRGDFLVVSHQPFTFDYNRDVDKAMLVTQALLRGDRPSEISYEAPGYNNRGSYEMFVHTSLQDLMVDGDYRIDSGTIFFESDFEHTPSKLTLYKQPSEEYSFELAIKHLEETDQDQKLRNWFHSLTHPDLQIPLGL